MRRKLQVFVSSTFIDLKVERQAAVEAILKAGHIPAGMELFTAGDKSQMKTIERWIDESDVYMLILGGRYGSLEPTTQTSYTELEYDYAASHATPLFAVVTTEQALEQKIKSLGSDCMEKDNPKQLRLFREKVLSRTSSFFGDTKDIKLCVHESLAELASDQDLALRGWVSGADIPNIKALQDEIAQLRAENAELLKQLKDAARRQPSSLSNFDELSAILQAVDITIPAEVAAGREIKTNLLTLINANRDFLITGVSNRLDASVSAKFYYFKVFPKLQAHGLADNEKVAGTSIRRSFLSKKGCAFVAEMDRRLLPSQNIEATSVIRKKSSASKQSKGK